MKVLAFAATSSRNSINKKLVFYASRLLEAGLIKNAEVEIIDLNNFEMPLYSIDREKEGGIPDLAQQFYKKIGDADALVIAFAEHNGYYTAVYKNLFDWASRIGKKVYQNKPSVLLASSPGPNGARNVLKVAMESAPAFGMDLRANVSIPRFYENFDVDQNQFRGSEFKEQLNMALTRLN
jgi:chromate reductase, NAD(P)H dehydrogenase (quinone)